MRCARPVIYRALLVATLAGCGVVRTSDFSPVCPSYEATIRPVLAARCGQCHSADAGYVIGEHAQTVSRSDDGTPRVAPGDPGSALLAAARGERPGHTAIPAADVTLLEGWVVQCRAAPRAYAFHPRGWTTPTDPEQFHGQALRATKYDFAECQKCHGEDLRGGASKVDCNGCHREGPQACNTCHGDARSPAPPRDLAGVRSTFSFGVGSHRAHVEDGPAHKAFACTRCHADVKDDRHYKVPGSQAPLQLVSGPTGTAKLDRATGTCSNVYCHAPAKDDTAPTRRDPVWTRAGKGDVTCGTCHGNPPSSHAANARCEVCHGAGYADGGVDLALHLDGEVSLRNGGVACDACHAGPDSPAFFDLQGRDAGVQTVGAHDAHLHANRLRGPMTCGECHRVPDTVLAPGHLDSPPPAEVFAIDLGALAFKQGARPTYNAANATCSSVYCHGGAELGHPDTAPGLIRAPSWVGSPAQAACGTCHGLPPRDGTIGHTAALTLPCDTCHSGSVLPDGRIRFTALPDGGVTSKHLDGKITGQ